IGGLFLRRHLLVVPHLTFTRAVAETGSRLVGMTGPLSFESHFFGKWFPLSITALGALSIAYIVSLVLAPVAERAGGHRDERDEAIIDVPSFNLGGRKMRNVRQSVAHSARAGETTEVHREGRLDPTLRRALVGISGRHLAGAPERGFSMGLDGVLTGRDPDTVLIVCRDHDRAPIA